MQIFNYNGKIYPDIIRRGNANKYIEPFAKEFCIGEGLDIGGFNEWVYPGAKPINITIDDEYDAYNLPDKKHDYIFSSHCLEHLPSYVEALTYWKTKIKDDGVLFLYLPHPEMEYWRPENNKKHLHLFHPKDLVSCLYTIGYKNILFSERDLYWSFCVVAFV